MHCNYFSSSEPKTRVSFSDHTLSVVRRCRRRCRYRKLFTLFFRTTRLISTKLSTKHSWVKRIQLVQMKGPALFQGEIIVKILKNLLQNNWTNFGKGNNVGQHKEHHFNELIDSCSKPNLY